MGSYFMLHQWEDTIVSL